MTDNSQVQFPKTAISDGTNVLGTLSTPVRVDPTGTTVQPVNVVSGGGTPPANGPTGSPVPADADYIGGKNGSGNLTGVSVDNSGNVNVNVVSGGGSNASVGSIGATAPTSATEIGGPDASGNLRAPTVSVKTNSNAMTVQIVDANGTQITTFGSSTVIANQGTASAGAKWSVQVDNASAIAVSEADGANVTLGAKADARSTATDTTAVSVISVLKEISFMEQNPASRAVTNAGTFAVQEATVDATIVTQGTSAPTKIQIVGGKSNDGTPQYKEIPLGAGARSVIVEGFAGGTAVPISAASLPLPSGAAQDSTLTGGTAKFGFAEPTTAGLTRASISVAASGDNTVIAGVGGQTIRVFRIFFVTAAAVNVTIKDGAGTSLTGAMSFLPNGGMVLDFTNEPWFVTSTANAFIINLSTAVQTSGAVYYTQS